MREGITPFSNTESIKPEIRELPPEDLWSASLEITLNREDLGKILQEVSDENNFSFSGYLTEEGGGLTYHFSRYPRKAFGPLPSVEDFEKILKILTDKTGGTPKVQEKTAEEKVRVLLGLVEGYGGEITHSLEEVRSIMGERASLKEAEIYSFRPRGNYSEPAVIIEEDSVRLNDIYRLAEQFKQSRLAVEDLHKGESFMVETKHCQDPDPKPEL